MRKSPHAGFTLIELLLVVALVAIVSAGGFAVQTRLVAIRRLDSAVGLSVGAMRRAQALSLGMRGDEPWGVHVASVQATIFRGASYATRDGDADEVSEFDAPIQVSDDMEVVFDKATGMPAAPATVSFQHDDDRYWVHVNIKGTVDHGAY